MYHSTHSAKETNKQTITNQEFMLLNKKKKNTIYLAFIHLTHSFFDKYRLLFFFSSRCIVTRSELSFAVELFSPICRHCEQLQPTVRTLHMWSSEFANVNRETTWEQRGLTFLTRVYRTRTMCAQWAGKLMTAYISGGCVPAVLKMSHCCWGQLSVDD